MNRKILDLAKRLITVPSTQENHKEITDVLEIAKNELIGFSCKSYEQNDVPSIIYYSTPIFPGEFSLILNAHLDVVSGKKDQFAPRVAGDRLYGRGAYDMKAAAAVEIFVYKELAKKVPYPLGLQLVTDEEVGGFNGAKYQYTRGVRTKSMLTGECSSNFSLGIRAKGIIWMTITFQGISAHAAYPWEGKNAVWGMVTFLNKLQNIYPVPNKKVWQTTVNVSTVNTENKTNNKVPDQVELHLDIRYVPEDAGSIIKSITSLLPKTAVVDITEHEPARKTSETNPYALLLKKTAEEILKKPIPMVGVNGGSDLRHYPVAAGLEFGPVGEGPHTDKEWVSLKSLDKYYHILRNFLLSIKF